MGKPEQVTREDVLALLNYDESTGEFKWKFDVSRSAKAGAVAGHVNRKGYVEIRLNGKLHKAHRLAWLVRFGVMPEDGVDHRNRVKSDNRIANLRLCDQELNLQNTNLSSASTSGAKGVNLHPASGLWRARIVKAGKELFLGYFKSIEEARKARIHAEKLIYPYSPLNQTTLGKKS